MLGRRKPQRTWFVWKMNNLKIYFYLFRKNDQWRLFGCKNVAITVFERRKLQIWSDVDDSKHGIAELRRPITVSMCLGRNDLRSVDRMVISTAMGDS